MLNPPPANLEGQLNLFLFSRSQKIQFSRKHVETLAIDPKQFDPPPSLVPEFFFALGIEGLEAQQTILMWVSVVQGTV